MTHLVRKINAIDGFKINLEFNNGQSKNIDLYAKLVSWSESPNSKFKDLLNPSYFKTVKIDEDLATIYWENGIDFCPDSLYEWGE
jgi:hypothetical protein